MKCSILVILVFLAGCKKSEDPTDKFSNNHIEIEVVSSTGSLTNYAFHGELAPMYMASGLYTTAKFAAEGKRDVYTRQIIFGVDASDSTNTVVSCTYFPAGDPNSYSTQDSIGPRTINFTSFSNNFAQGYFSATCVKMSDTILIRGTFSGNYNN